MRSRVRLLAASGVLLTMLGIGACERAATVVSPARAPAEPAVDPVTGLLLARLETAGGSAASRGFVPAAGALGAVAGVATSSAATFSSATLLTFEDLPSGQVNMGLVNPYHGVTFSSTSSSCALYDENDAGYMQAHSGEHYLFNAWGCDGEWLAFGGPVYFGGAWVSSPNVVTAAPELWFEGYRRGTLVGASARVTLQKGGAMQHLEANFPGVVDSVVIRRTTGSPAWPRGYYGVDDVCFGTAPVTAACEVAPNSAPTASVGGPYTGEEGAALALALGGSDPQGDALTYTWDFGDGAGSTGATPPASHVYADNGVYTLTLSVSDGHGGTDTRTTTATITNVAPTVSLSGPAQIYSGQQAAFTGSFSDPGLLDAPWQEAFDWGTGSALKAQSATEGTVDGQPTYLTAGSYTVTLSVTDKDGGTGQATAALTVVRRPLAVDITPGSSKNPVNLSGNGGASIAVAVLSSASFDASTIDVASVTLGADAGGIGVARRKNGSYQTSLEDANGDGRRDLVLHFDRQALIDGGWINASTAALTLLATLQNGVQVAGSDLVTPIR